MIYYFIALCPELLTFSPCREGNPPVPGNGEAKVTLIIYWQSATAERGHECTGTSVRAFTGSTSERRGRSLTNIDFTHWKLPPVTFQHTHTHTHGIRGCPADITAAATFLCSGKEEPHRLFGYSFWILMPDLITQIALLSGSSPFFFGDEGLRYGAERIRTVSWEKTSKRGGGGGGKKMSDLFDGRCCQVGFQAKMG